MSKITEYKDSQSQYAKDDRGDATGAFAAFVRDPSPMAQEPRNMYAGGQLVQPNIDGSRPGYKGDETFLVKVGKPLKVKNVIEQEFIEVIGSKNRPETYKKTGVKKTLYKPQIIVGNKTVLTTNFGTKDAATSAVEKYRKTTPIKNAPPDLDTLDKQKKKKYLAKREKSAKIIAGDGVERFATGDDIIDKGHAQNINNPDIKIKPRNIIYTPKKINQSMAGQGANISPTDLDFKINVTENKIKDIKKGNMSGAKKKIDLEKLDTKLMKYVAQSDGYKTVTLSDGQVYGEIFQKKKSMDMFDEFLGTEKETKKFVNQYFSDEGKLKDKWRVNKNGFLKNNPSIKLSDIDRANIQKSYVFLENIKNAKSNAKKQSKALFSFMKRNDIKCSLSNGVDCGRPEAYVKSINELKAKAAAGDKKAAEQLIEVTKGMSKGGKLLRSLIGPGAILFEPVYEGTIMANKVLDGKPLNQAWAESYLSYLDSERVDPKTLEREEMLYRQIEGPERKVKGGQGTVRDMINIDAGGASKLRPLFAAEDTMSAFEQAKKDKRRGEFIDRKDIENRAAADIRDMRKTGSVNFAQQRISDPATQEALSKAQEYVAAKRGAASSIPQSAQADERRRKEAMKAEGILTIQDAKNELQNIGNYYGQGYTPFGQNKLYEKAGMQNPGYGITKVGPATGKYNQAQGLQDYLNSMKMQTIADAGGVANMASGGIMNLKKKYYD